MLWRVNSWVETIQPPLAMPGLPLAAWLELHTHKRNIQRFQNLLTLSDFTCFMAILAFILLTTQPLTLMA